MANISSKQVVNPYTDREQTYWTVTDNEGNSIYGGYSESEAQGHYKQLKREEAEQAAEAADGNAASTSSSSSGGGGGGAGGNGYGGWGTYGPGSYAGPLTEPSPPWTPMFEPEPPDPKIVPLLAGIPPNSMATGNPKDYPGTDTADPENSGPDYPDPIHSEEKKSEVDVKSIMDNAGDATAAAAAVAAAVNDTIANKAVSLAAEYTAKMIALPASIPGRIAGYTSARVGKSKGDIDRNGQPYEPVKLSLGDVMPQMTTPVEDLDESKKEDNNEKKKNKKADEAKKKASKFIESAQKVAAKSAETIGKITSHIAEGAEWVQQNVDKEIARAEKNITQELETGYKKIEKDIDDFCQDEGDKIGSNIVRLYNKELEKQAKKIVDEKKKVEKKAKIKADAAIQKAKLKIFALIGL